MEDSILRSQVEKVYNIEIDEMIALCKEIQVDTDHEWGRELIFHMGSESEPYTLKLLELQHPHVLSSYHYHKKIHETLVVISGVVSIRVDSKTFKLFYPGQFINVQPLQKHQFFAVHNPALLMEGSDRCDPNDDVKKEDLSTEDIEDRANSQFIGEDG